MNLWPISRTHSTPPRISPLHVGRAQCFCSSGLWRAHVDVSSFDCSWFWAQLAANCSKNWRRRQTLSRKKTRREFSPPSASNRIFAHPSRKWFPFAFRSLWQRKLLIFIILRYFIEFPCFAAAPSLLIHADLSSLALTHSTQKEKVAGKEFQSRTLWRSSEASCMKVYLIKASDNRNNLISLDAVCFGIAGAEKREVRSGRISIFRARSRNFDRKLARCLLKYLRAANEIVSEFSCDFRLLGWCSQQVPAHTQK